MGAGEAISTGEGVAIYAELNGVSMYLDSDSMNYIVGHMLHQLFVHQRLRIISLSTVVAFKVCSYVLGYTQTNIPVWVRLGVP